MESQVLIIAAVAALGAFVLVQVLLAAWLKRSLDRRIDSLAARPDADAASLVVDSEDRFADVAPELVTLARTATDAAIRREEIEEWHRPSLNGGAEDDIAGIVRDKLRRASLNALASRSALHVAIRRHREVLPAELQAELAAFCEGLDAHAEGRPDDDRKRRLAADLDRVEARFREALGTRLTAAP